MIDPMIIKEITAHHEAAHAVLTHISKFHSLIGVIRLASEDIGDTFVSLSKRKLARAGKPTDLEVLTDPDYVEDASTIYLAGFAAELHYCKLNAQLPENYILNRTYSDNDYNAVKELISKAGLPKDKMSFYETQASAVVVGNWRHIQEFAGLILNSNGNTVDAVDAMDYLDSVFGTHSLYPMGRRLTAANYGTHTFKRIVAAYKKKNKLGDQK
jgi:hypothetical protein